MVKIPGSSPPFTGRIPSTYCLLVYVSDSFNESICCLGEAKIEAGFHVYVGSALKGMWSRIARHLKDEKKIRWHIDYLTVDPRVSVQGVAYGVSDKHLECNVVKELLKAGLSVSVPRFGSSDCRDKCPSHLLRKVGKVDYPKLLRHSLLRAGCSHSVWLRRPDILL